MSQAPAEQFVDLDQQHHAAELGMWVFLTTEVLFFGALFTLYTAYRVQFPEAFSIGSGHLYRWIGAVNTAVLLISSLLVALGVDAARLGRRRLTSVLLAVAALLGLAFLGIKAVEYGLDTRDHLIPGYNAEAGRVAGQPHVHLFLTLYLLMTGVHALHVFIGVCGLGLLALRHALRKATPPHANTVEMVGLYWHFVDIVWVFLFPLLYLI